MRVFALTKETMLRVLIVAAVASLSLFFIFNGKGGAAPAFAPKDNIPIYSVKTSGGQVAITLDAAWGSDKTHAILDIADKYHVKFTFFITGMWAKANSEALKEIVSRGHEIGSHSYSHKDYATINDAQIVEDLKKADDAIEGVTGKRTTIFRAPYGSWNARIVDAVCGQQYDFIQWDVDSLDWQNKTPEQMEARIFAKVQSGSIMLFHNDAKYIVEALPGIIEKLQAKGLKPVTVSELVAESLEARN